MGFQVTDVQKALSGMDYPASPDELADHASSHGGSDDLVEALRGIDRKEIDGPSGVMHELKGQLGGSTDD